MSARQHDGCDQDGHYWFRQTPCPHRPRSHPRHDLFGNISLTLTVTALSWSKTSFAVTLLRVTTSWSKKLVWFIIASMTVLFFWTALVHWVYCSSIAKAWNPFLEGTCWDYALVVDFDIQGCGKIAAHSLAGSSLGLTKYPAYSAAMDFALSSLAWYTVKDLRMRTCERVGVIVFTSIGVLLVLCLTSCCDRISG